MILLWSQTGVLGVCGTGLTDPLPAAADSELEALPEAGLLPGLSTETMITTSRISTAKAAMPTTSLLRR